MTQWQRERPPACAVGNPCGARAEGVVWTGTRAANTCGAHGQGLAAKGARYTPITRWAR